MNLDTPYSDLTPECILKAIENIGVRCDGRLQSLNSYENRVYQVGLEDGNQYVAKFYRPGRWSDEAILEEHAFSLELADQEIPVVPPISFNGITLHHWQGYRFTLFAKQGGRTPELEKEETLEWLGRFMGRIHAIGATSNYTERPSINIQRFGIEPRDFILNGEWVPHELRPAWISIADEALNNVSRIFLRISNVQMLRLHGDCHPGNLLWTAAGPHFVDFDDSLMGPAIQDLWMLLSGNAADMRLQFSALMRGYETFMEFDDRELQLIEALRTLRLIHYSAWIAKRWHDPAFPRAFPWFGTVHYWQDRILELREQVALMQEPVLS